MIGIKSFKIFTGAGILSAIAASLCCITPVVALLAGSSTVVANFSWIEPARPFLITLSIAFLLLCWYEKIKPTDVGCTCETPKRASFLRSKSFLGIVTAFAIVMMTFPLYAKFFYSGLKVQAATVAAPNRQQVKFTIHGMTCEGCEHPINNELSKLGGVLTYKTSYINRSSLVSFDKSKVDLKTIEATINKTGYKVKSFDVRNAPDTTITF